MALIYATGHDLTLTINSVTYADVCSSATLTVENDQQVIETLSGRSYKTVAKSGTLDVELYQDWTSTSTGTTSNSICKALWNLANTAPDTAIVAVLKVGSATGVIPTYTFNVFPVFPPIGGGANDALTTSVSFVVEDGSVVATTV
jgi:hypothetical protein